MGESFNGTLAWYRADSSINKYTPVCKLVERYGSLLGESREKALLQDFFFEKFSSIIHLQRCIVHLYYFLEKNTAFTIKDVKKSCYIMKKNNKILKKIKLLFPRIEKKRV